MITYLAKGDVALSALSSWVTVLTIPLLTQWAGQRFLGDAVAIALPLGPTLLQLAAIVLLPTGLGMLGRVLAPAVAQRLEKQVSWWAAGLLALIIGLLLLRESSRLPLFLQQVGIATVLLNLTVMGSGWRLAKLLRLPLPQQVCLAVEGTLAITLTAGLLQRPELAIPAAVYRRVMYLTGGLVIYWGRQAIAPMASE